LGSAASFTHSNYQDPTTQVRKNSSNKQSEESDVCVLFWYGDIKNQC